MIGGGGLGFRVLGLPAERVEGLGEDHQNNAGIIGKNMHLCIRILLWGLSKKRRLVFGRPKHLDRM